MTAATRFRALTDRNARHTYFMALDRLWKPYHTRTMTIAHGKTVVVRVSQQVLDMLDDLCAQCGEGRGVVIRQLILEAHRKASGNQLGR